MRPSTPRSIAFAKASRAKTRSSAISPGSVDFAASHADDDFADDGAGVEVRVRRSEIVECEYAIDDGHDAAVGEVGQKVLLERAHRLRSLGGGAQLVADAEEMQA